MPGHNENEDTASAPSTHPMAGESETLAAGPPPPKGPSRFRRWSESPPVRTGGLTLVAGLIGGLVGGGIVTAFSDNGSDHRRPMRVERFMPGGGPGFRPGFGPGYWGPPGGRWAPPSPPAVTPTPSPKASG